MTNLGNDAKSANQIGVFPLTDYINQQVKGGQDTFCLRSSYCAHSAQMPPKPTGCVCTGEQIFLIHLRKKADLNFSHALHHFMIHPRIYLPCPTSLPFLSLGRLVSCVCSSSFPFQTLRSCNPEPSDFLAGIQQSVAAGEDGQEKRRGLRIRPAERQRRLRTEGRHEQKMWKREFKRHWEEMRDSCSHRFGSPAFQHTNCASVSCISEWIICMKTQLFIIYEKMIKINWSRGSSTTSTPIFPSLHSVIQLQKG